ncbi:type II toxin-antitoxin system RelE/ParE family toxin [Acetivibrio cellulolyticus]|uniref:type II toxin-antitoxin system RelE/ParE family toxin n=1 Tax=Acetivibrio cellulolyticus TaxID=35830 RepID=UPI0001E2C745|nr:type II toxin-antitoxin system RelE/ParE family toxin [Acetivibrio cellulolyticus]
MKYKIVITEQADADLRRIYEYIAFNLHEPAIAEGQLKSIEKGIRGLDEMPGRFRRLEIEPWRSRRLCQMPVDNFIVFYIPQNEDKTVTVIRVLYGGMDIDKEIKKTSI